MSEAANKRAVRRYYECVDAGDNECIFDLHAENVVYRRPGQGNIEGIEELKTFYREERPISGGEHDLRMLVAADNLVASRGRFEGTIANERVELGFAEFYRFADERIVERWSFTDRDEV